jgi:8-oxo-dGTP pyrophosphatase MutT (NUDIX family)
VTLHQDAVAVLSGWAAPSEAQADLRDRYLAHLAEHADGLSKPCFPAHLTASCLVLSADRSRVLLTLHAKARQWFQFGGHCEPSDETLAGAALREATEESGLATLTLLPGPVHLDAHRVDFCHRLAPVDHLDVRFAAITAYDVPVVSDESLDVRWWPVDRLPTDEPSMRELVDLALRLP